MRRRPSSQLWRRFRRSTPAKAGLIIVMIFTLLAVLAPVIKPYDPTSDRSFRDKLKPPSVEHIFGTDNLGRDVATRVLHGARISLQVGIVATLLAMVVGSLLGLLAGYYGGWIDSTTGWLSDILLAFPGILLAIGIVAVRGPGLTNTMIAVSIVQIPIYLRLARSVVISVREREFVQAAGALGAGQNRILFKHVLPNSVTPLIVQASLSIATATIEAAALGFLGLGAQPPAPEWGTMLADAFQVGVYLTAPWTMIFPGLAILFTVLGFNLLGDGLRDVLDPRSTQ
ncbi:peptide/nickel transport system permease protein [Deinobacterium chartae]|uniref:Peptide/nickel transport system permease protein n=1 Tax=Deinobacterium chartae TaxID=521158 RepID=A0A841I2Q9_9DEIO|nr:peptide/nickel transport system permease protein [Deinobacterium chartae]